MANRHGYHNIELRFYGDMRDAYPYRGWDRAGNMYWVRKRSYGKQWLAMTVYNGKPCGLTAFKAATMKELSKVLEA